jgi:hypothetical protein
LADDLLEEHKDPPRISDTDIHPNGYGVYMNGEKTVHPVTGQSINDMNNPLAHIEFRPPPA